MTDTNSSQSDLAVHSSAFSAQLLRMFAWANILLMFAYLINNYLIFWMGWPGFLSVLTGNSFGTPNAVLGWLQVFSYIAALALAVFIVWSKKDRTLRADSLTMQAMTNYVIRAAFWMVVIVGLADMIISFLRVEGFLENVVGQDMANKLGRPNYRGPYVHVPLILLSLVVAAVTRTLGFTWLALLVVVAELQIVLLRFIFSYEQAFMGDIVRFWYASLFLFASAYTLIEEGHVRVDVLYSGFQDSTKGMVNLVGSIFLGLSLCWVVLFIGFEGKSSIINAPILSYEVTQSGFGMYVKYLMAGFLAIFAISMLIQFSAYLLEGYADYRNEPGKRKLDAEITH